MYPSLQSWFSLQVCHSLQLWLSLHMCPSLQSWLSQQSWPRLPNIHLYPSLWKSFILWYENPPSFHELRFTSGYWISIKYLDHQTVMRLHNTSTSRKNFASLLVWRVFTYQERATCNVNGQNKLKLDPIRINYVKTTVFQMYPLMAEEVSKRAWAECVISIDEANRQLNRKNKVVVAWMSDSTLLMYIVLLLHTHVLQLHSYISCLLHKTQSANPRSWWVSIFVLAFELLVARARARVKLHQICTV